MRFPIACVCSVLGLAPLIAAVAEPAAGRVWQPMAAWYGPGVRVAQLTDLAVEHSEVRLKLGDDPQWAKPPWNDDDWTVVARNALPADAGIFWLRLRVRTPPDMPVPGLVFIGGGLAHEFFWDGERIHGSGRPGHGPDEEIVGMNNVQIELPSSAVAPGEHVIALRVSTFRRQSVGVTKASLFLYTVPPEAYRSLDGRLRLLPAMGTGAMLTLGAVAVVFWFLADRRLVLGVLATLCLASALLVAVAAAPWTISYPADWGFHQSMARVGLTATVVALSVATAWQQLAPPAGRAWLLAPVVVCALVSWVDVAVGIDRIFLTWRIGFVAILAIGVTGLRRRRAESGWVIGGALTSFALFENAPRHFDKTGFVLGYTPLLLGLIAAVAIQVRRERRQSHETALKAARLELELLRKTIQPHFLLNTLTALTQLVEESPPKAVRLIHDLAAEFRSLTRLAAESEVTLADELALCRAHLCVMSARTEVPWTLETRNVDLGARVPPALFLTLIENGFSHQRPSPGATTFRLEGGSAGANVRYVFLSPGKIRGEARAESGGTGLRYVRTRLEENFPGAWRLEQRETPDGWETTIEFAPAARARP
jgi:hypothetical protein